MPSSNNLYVLYKNRNTLRVTFYTLYFITYLHNSCKLLQIFSPVLLNKNMQLVKNFKGQGFYVFFCSKIKACVFGWRKQIVKVFDATVTFFLFCHKPKGLLIFSNINWQLEKCCWNISCLCRLLSTNLWNCCWCQQNWYSLCYVNLLDF